MIRLLSPVRALARLAVRLVGAVYAVTLLVAIAVEISIPGGFRDIVLPATAPTNSPRAQATIETWRLDDPLLVRHFRWLVDAAGGDFGRSSRSNVPVGDLVWPRLPVSLELTLVSVAAAVAIGVPLGLWAAARAQRRDAAVLNSILGVSQTVPVFVSSLFFSWVLAVELQWLPAAGWVRISDSLWGNLRTLALPALTLVVAELGPIGRVVRADVVRVLESDVIAAARSKGLGTGEILFRHALRPGSLGLLNVLALNVGSLLSGTIVVEIIFGLPGLGQLLLESVLNRDLHVLFALTAYVAVIYVLLTALVDLVMQWADPRIARSSASVPLGVGR